MRGPRNSRLDFGGNPDHNPDPDLRRRLASAEGIAALGVRVCVSVCVSAEPRLHAVGGEGNALYPVLSSLLLRVASVKCLLLLMMMMTNMTMIVIIIIIIIT